MLLRIKNSHRCQYFWFTYSGRRVFVVSPVKCVFMYEFRRKVSNTCKIWSSLGHLPVKETESFIFSCQMSRMFSPSQRHGTESLLKSALLLSWARNSPLVWNSLHKFPLLVLNRRQYNEFISSAPLFSRLPLIHSEGCAVAQVVSLRLFTAEISFRSQDLWQPNWHYETPYLEHYGFPTPVLSMLDTN
jgi:hypothetical protein